MNLTRDDAGPTPGSADISKMSCGKPAAAAANGHCRDCAVHARAFCAVLDDAALASLDKLHAIVDLGRDDCLYLEGDMAADFFTILSGALRLSNLLPDGRRQITGFVLPGEFVGLSTAKTYIDNADALTEVRLCRFSRSDLARMGQDYPELDGRLLAMTNDTLTRAREHMLLLGRMTAPEKIAHFLFSLALRVQASGQPAGQLVLPMSRSDIADFLGLTIETVSRTFTELKSDNVISLPEHNRVLAGSKAPFVVGNGRFSRRFAVSAVFASAAPSPPHGPRQFPLLALAQPPTAAHRPAGHRHRPAPTP